MSTAWQYIEVERRDGLSCVRLRNSRLEEEQIDALAGELVAAGLADDCHAVALSLGPRPPDCLYSIFLGKLISVQRQLRERGRNFFLCDAGPTVQAIFAACRLTEHFQFVADFDAAATFGKIPT